jgi:hypothetical protein
MTGTADDDGRTDGWLASPRRRVGSSLGIVVIIAVIDGAPGDAEERHRGNPARPSAARCSDKAFAAGLFAPPSDPGPGRFGGVPDGP